MPELDICDVNCDNEKAVQNVDMIFRSKRLLNDESAKFQYFVNGRRTLTHKLLACVQMLQR